MHEVVLPDGLVVVFGAHRIRSTGGVDFNTVGLTPDVSVPLEIAAVSEEGTSALRDWRQRVTEKGFEEVRRMIGE